MNLKVDDLDFNFPTIKKNKILEPSAEICIPCRGAKYLCGRSYCPLIVKTTRLLKTIELRKRLIEGSSPPSVFVGRMGYPNVRIGPLVPSIIGDTSHFDLPEIWTNYKIEDILSFRFSMVRSYTFARVEDAKFEPRWLIDLQELISSKNPVDIEIKLSNLPSGKPFLDDVIEPIGPSAKLESYEILSNVKMDDRIEKIYYDKDLRASEAILKLYFNNLEISKISKVLSLGMLGLGKNRKLVPTRWSITAVDDTISKNLVEKIKEYPVIDKIRIYYKEKHLNRFIILMLPSKWSYEWIEAWYPNTTWNLYGADVEAESDYEGYHGRSSYANLGGCYYAVRLAIAERLNLERRQATVLAIREILPGFVTSIGVWFVRESMREILRGQYLEFEDIKEALEFIFSRLKLNKEKIINKSSILKNIYFQRKIHEFLDKFNA
jgi:hypothetical protein